MDLDRNKLLNIYDSIQEKRQERESYVEKVQKLDRDIQIEILEYRINSVIRVLEYFSGLDNDFDNLIVHCLNKLNGNIDGIELELGGKNE